MQNQEYLRAHDVGVLLQLAIDPALTFRDLSRAVGLSLGETHNAAKRLELARLASPSTDRINGRSALEFLSFGVPFSFPAQLGAPARGIPTAYSAEPLEAEIASEESVVWPSPHGSMRGTSLVPLYPAAPDIAQSNPQLYRLLALLDGIRVGRARERRAARAHLERALASFGSVWIEE